MDRRVIRALADGLAPHLPDAATATALSPTVLAIRRGTASPLRYDLAEAGATTTATDPATLSALTWVLTAIQADLTEWSGHPWPSFPAARTTDGGEPATWAQADGTTALGYRSPSGWSLQVLTLS